ncbi:MAG: ABC transporter ATP-binding protein [Eubacteriales bacterium]|nr:ABC transporter ATP-binding protein [Clostridia bacterium]MDY2696537.1 ABC transporter ATP-binding protein [Eubacteriales bacterium]
MLELKDYTKIYPNNKVGADKVNLKVESGDIFAFIGHNGAGKTTTIKSIVGINDITSGDIIIDGVSIKENPILCKQKIAYVPDNPDIYPALTGIQYINLVADFFKVDKKKREDLTKKYATELELINDLNNQISTYSHGMRQKLVLISAFIHEPKLLILDEPFVGLDPKATYILKETMQNFVKNGGAIFFSTHVLDVAEKLCNKVAIIKDGKIIANGTMAEIKKDSTLENVFLESENV